MPKHKKCRKGLEHMHADDLSDRELLIRLDERTKNMDKTFNESMYRIEMRFSEQDKKFITTDKAKLLIYGTIGSIIIALLSAATTIREWFTGKGG